jgi:hypothetical protein
VALVAVMNNKAAPIARAIAVNATGLRPIWSDSRPRRNSMLSVPAT